MVEIKVGKERSSYGLKSFFIHRGLLCFYSGYFSAALNGKFYESKTGIIALETEQPEVFERFQHWIYTRRLCEHSQTDTKALDYKDIAQLWVFGDAHQIPILQNQVMDLFKRKVVESWGLPIGQVNWIYLHTTESAHLRKFCIDIIGKTASAYMVSSIVNDHEWAREPLIDLMKVIWKPEKSSWSKDEVAKLDMCQYHVHDRGVKCGEVKK